MQMAIAGYNGKPFVKSHAIALHKYPSTVTIQDRLKGLELFLQNVSYYEYWVQTLNVNKKS